MPSNTALFAHFFRSFPKHFEHLSGLDFWGMSSIKHLFWKPVLLREREARLFVAMFPLAPTSQWDTDGDRGVQRETEKDHKAPLSILLFQAPSSKLQVDLQTYRPTGLQMSTTNNGDPCSEQTRSFIFGGLKGARKLPWTTWYHLENNWL